MLILSNREVLTAAALSLQKSHAALQWPATNLRSLECGVRRCQVAS